MKLFICFDSTIYGVSPSMPQDKAKMKLFIIKVVCYLLSPDGPQKLSSKYVPGRVRIEGECRCSVPLEFCFHTRSFWLGHESTINLFPCGVGVWEACHKSGLFKQVHANWTSSHSRNACCSVSLSCLSQIRQWPGSPSFSLHAPTGKPSARIIHCKVDTFRGRYGCQRRLKNLARALLSKPSASSSASMGI